MLNEDKEYKNLVCKAEVELNKELNNIKNGNINDEFEKYVDRYNEDDLIINKKIEIIDERRNVYKVTVNAEKLEKRITVQGYEQYSKENKYTEK